jgi:hypothetical protein
MGVSLSEIVQIFGGGKSGTIMREKWFPSDG